MNTAWTWSGWIVAAALAAVAVVQVVPGPDAAKETAVSATKAEKAGRPSAAPPEASVSGSNTAPPEAPASGPSSAPAAAVVDDAWKPPGDIEGIEGICASLAHSTPQERALGERILAAYKAEDKKAILSAAQEALNCPEPRVCAMAVEAMGKTDEMPQPETAELLLGFSAHENTYVRHEAFLAFSDCMGDAGDDETMSTDDAVRLSVKALETLDFSDEVGDFALALAWRDAFDKGRDCLDPTPIEKAAAAFGGLARSEDERIAQLGRWALSNILSNDYVRRGDELYDDAKVERLLAERRADVAEAKSLFPDDKGAAGKYVLGCRALKEEAEERYGDDDDAAAAWLAEEKAFFAKKIAEGFL